MDSAKNWRYIIPFKKFGMVRVKIIQHKCLSNQDNMSCGRTMLLSLRSRWCLLHLLHKKQSKCIHLLHTILEAFITALWRSYYFHLCSVLYCYFFLFISQAFKDVPALIQHHRNHDVILLNVKEKKQHKTLLKRHPINVNA